MTFNKRQALKLKVGAYANKEFIYQSLNLFKLKELLGMPVPNVANLILEDTGYSCILNNAINIYLTN